MKGLAVEMADGLPAVPGEVELRLKDALAEILEVIAGEPPGSSPVLLMRSERLQLDLLGWRFLYEVDAEGGRVRVVSAREVQR